MIEPLRFSFVVGCPPAHAFETWTSRASSWWPVEHTVSAERGLEVVFEPRAGGRIFERTPAGAEIEWGRITDWDPPRRLVYQWHIAADPTDATEVEIVFEAVEDESTRVEVEHRGWEGLAPEKGRSWREANQGGWDGVLPSYIAACEGLID